VILQGPEFWAGLIEWITTHQLARGMLSAEDLAQAEVADGVEDVMSRLCAGVCAPG
jgi:predicted Rossmann-fold nucleotide-binding protein